MTKRRNTSAEARSRRNLWSRVIIILIIVVGLGLLAVPRTFDIDEHSAWRPWLHELGVILLIAGTVGVVDKTILYADLLAELDERFRLIPGIRESGLSKLGTNSDEYPYDDLIDRSQHLAIVVNHGKRWFFSRLRVFQDRLAKPGFTTEVFFPSPNGAFIHLLAKKTPKAGRTDAERVSDLREKVVEVTEKLRELWMAGGRKAQLRIYHSPYFPPHSVFQGTDKAVITLYTHSSHEEPVPYFEYSRDDGPWSGYWWIHRDMDRLRSQSVVALNLEPTKSDALVMDEASTREIETSPLPEETHIDESSGAVSTVTTRIEGKAPKESSQ